MPEQLKFVKIKQKVQEPRDKKDSNFIMTSKDVVWAKVKYHSFWPAIIVAEPSEEIKKLGKQGLICVRFFGANHDYGWVEPNNINGYCVNREKYRHKKRKGLAEAVLECDAFLKANTKTVEKNEVHNAIDQLATETVTVRTELPFNIKTEPLDEDEFFQSNIVKVRNAAIQSKNKNTEKAREAAEIFETKSEPSSSSSSSSTNEPHKLETQLQAIMVEVRTLLVEKKEAEKETNELRLKYNCLLEKGINVNSSEPEQQSIQCDQLLTEKTKLEGELDDIKSKYDLSLKELIDRSVRCDQLTAANTKLEQELQDIKSKHETSLKELTDNNESKILGYEKLLKENTERIDLLSADKKSLEDSIKENASKHNALSKELTDKMAKYDPLLAEKTELQAELDDIKSKHGLSLKELTDRSVRCVQLTSEKTKLEQELHDIKSKHKTSLKELTDNNESKIRKNDKLLKENTERINLLLADKTNLEETIKENASKHNALSKELTDKMAKCDQLLAEKTELQGKLDGITSKYESSSKTPTDVSSQSDQTLAFQVKSKVAKNATKQSSKQKHESKREGENSFNKRTDQTVPGKPQTPIKLKRNSFAEKKNSPEEMPQKRGKHNKHYEVESLLEHKIKGGVRYYLIRWKGYEASFDTWENEANLHCAALLAEYKKKHNLA